MFRSLTTKLILGFAVVCVVEAVVVALFLKVGTGRAVSDLVRSQALEAFSQDVGNYYRERGSWDGISEAFRHPRRPGEGLGRREGPGLPGPPGSPGPLGRGQNRDEIVAFALADLNGIVVVPGARLRIGQRLEPEVLEKGVPLESEGRIVGTILFPNRLPLDPRERAFLNRINRALSFAVVLGLIIAAVLGALIARTYAKPVRQLTAAAEKLASGGRPDPVETDSKDEVGVLARTFNRMAADLLSARAARRQMTADVAHELRTPLTVLSGYLEALQSGTLEPTPDRIEAMNVEAHRLSALVEDLRTLSLADAGELSISKQPTNPRVLLEQTAAEFQHRADEKGIALEIEAPELPAVWLDQIRMLQVLGNLVDNALRFTDRGGVVRLTATRQGQSLILTVEDNGLGIPAEHQPHVFQRLYQVDPERSAGESGSGLGLAIAKSIVIAHNGSIELCSEQGTGSRFTITVPY